MDWNIQLHSKLPTEKHTEHTYSGKNSRNLSCFTTLLSSPKPVLHGLRSTLESTEEPFKTTQSGVNILVQQARPADCNVNIPHGMQGFESQLLDFQIQLLINIPRKMRQQMIAQVLGLCNPHGRLHWSCWLMASSGQPHRLCHLGSKPKERQFLLCTFSYSPCECTHVCIFFRILFKKTATEVQSIRLLCFQDLFTGPGGVA